MTFGELRQYFVDEEAVVENRNGEYITKYTDNGEPIEEIDHCWDSIPVLRISGFCWDNAIFLIVLDTDMKGDWE